MNQMLVGWKVLREKQKWSSVCLVVADSLWSLPLATLIILSDSTFLMQCEKHCSRSELLFDLLSHTQAQVWGLACLITIYSLSCVKFSACGDTNTWPFQQCVYIRKEKKQSEVQPSFDTDIPICFQSLSAVALSFSDDADTLAVEEKKRTNFFLVLSIETSWSYFWNKLALGKIMKYLIHLFEIYAMFAPHKIHKDYKINH